MNMDTQFLSTNGSNKSCLESIDYLNRNLHPYETLSLLVPIDNRVWTERNTTWYTLFKVMIALLGLLYFTVGIVSVILLVRRDSMRLGMRTFFAVYLSMAILGFSRAAFFALDPFGVLGYISDQFSAWIIVSRFMAALGFPSLVAACTLIILTLIKLANAKPGKQWYECWTYVLTLLVLPYAPALVAEALGHINTYSAIFSGIVCETFFVLWGLSICILFLSAGTRLLNTLKNSHRNTTTVSQGHAINQRQSNTSADFTMRDRKTRRIARKIIVITFGTATTGILYSLASAAAVILVLLLTFMDCMGLENRTSSDAWLAILFANFLTEILFVGFILYSMTDISLLLCFFKHLLLCCFASTESEIQQDPELNLPSMPEGRIQENGSMQTGMYLDNPDTAIEVDDQLENRFTIKTKKNSDSSVESVETEEEQKSLRHNRGRKVSRSHDTLTDAEEALRGRKVSRSHDALTDAKPESGVRPSKLPLDLETVSKVLSISDSPPQPYSLCPPKRKLKRTRGSDPTLARPNSDFSLCEPLLRHCKSHTPTNHHQHKVFSEARKLVTRQSHESLPTKPPPPPKTLSCGSMPPLPKPFERQATT